MEEKIKIIENVGIFYFIRISARKKHLTLEISLDLKV